MRRSYEEDDNCAKIYCKSLLYLVYAACEPERNTPILGLAECLRRDAELKALFGLGGAPSAKGEVVWSKSESGDGRSASSSTSHGGFDDDAPTMNSVLRRVRSLEDQDPIEGYPATGVRGGGALERDWLNEVDWPEFFNRPPRPVGVALPGVSPAVPAGIPTPSSGTVPVLGVPTLPAATGRRLALTIGINAYPTAPLHGCVADADLWDKTLRGLGFEMQPPLRDGEATRERIMAEMNALVGGARAGDTVVIQYAGHGTQVEDLDGDEADGDTPGEDEAICPFDFANGRFLIDDDVAEIVARLPTGAQLTFLLDCCHSGTGSRFAAAGDAAEPMDPTAKPRFVRFTDELRQAHREFRASAGRAAASRGFGSKPAQGLDARSHLRRVSIARSRLGSAGAGRVHAACS